jgi:hypothetical protein
LSGEDFDKVILQVDDKEQTASTLRAALKTSGTTASSDWTIAGSRLIGLSPSNFREILHNASHNQKQLVPRA